MTNATLAGGEGVGAPVDSSPGPLPLVSSAAVVLDDASTVVNEVVVGGGEVSDEVGCGSPVVDVATAGATD